MSELPADSRLLRFERGSVFPVQLLDVRTDCALDGGF